MSALLHSYQNKLSLRCFVFILARFGFTNCTYAASSAKDHLIPGTACLKPSYKSLIAVVWFKSEFTNQLNISGYGSTISDSCVGFS